MRHAKKLALAVAVLTLVAVSCSSSESSDSADSNSPAAHLTVTSAATTTSLPPEIPVSVVVPFTTVYGEGSIEISGISAPVVDWFASHPGEVSVTMGHIAIEDKVAIVEEIVNLWFREDEDSENYGEIAPFVFENAGEITDSLGSRYVVEAQPFPLAPGTFSTPAVSEIPGITATVPGNTETTTTTTTVSEEIPETTTTTTATTAVPEEIPETATTTTTTAAAAEDPPETTTTTTAEPAPAVTLQVQVLNGSGVPGAAGRMTEKLSQAGYATLPPGNAPRYRNSAVYYRENWEEQATEILEASEIAQIENPEPMPPQFSGNQASVIVLLGTDTAPPPSAPRPALRPAADFSVKLPLGDDVPRDRYVPGLANIQIYTPENENDPQVQPRLVRLSDWIRGISHHANEEFVFGIFPEDRSTREGYLNLMREIETELEWLGFTPQNVCGAPEGYSFTELLQPTREWDEGLKTYGGDAIFTTDRLLELHGGERINPEDNLDFYISEAVQTAHDILRSVELLDETEAPQLILCEAWISPAGEIPEFANAVWYSLLTPGTQPQENLLSQGTYHIKEISRNGNFAYMVVCHPAIGARFVELWWRDAGYRAEVVEDIRTSGCQAAFEEYDDYFAGTTPDGYGNYFAEDTISFGFGERTFSASEMLEFPR